MTEHNENSYRLSTMSAQAVKTMRAATANPTQPRVQSATLFGAHREVVIVHNGREYRLRLTQNGKLILTA